jgi:hypothetical protein
MGTGLLVSLNAMPMQKEAYKEKMEAQMSEWEGRIKTLKAKAEMMSGDAKIAYHERIKDLEKAKDSLGEKLSAMKDTGSDTWERVKKEVEDAIADIKAKFDKMTK